MRRVSKEGLRRTWNADEWNRELFVFVVLLSPFVSSLCLGCPFCCCCCCCLYLHRVYPSSPRHSGTRWIISYSRYTSSLHHHHHQPPTTTKIQTQLHPLHETPILSNVYTQLSKTNLLVRTAAISQSTNPQRIYATPAISTHVLSNSLSLLQKSPPYHIDTVRPPAAYGKQPPSSKQNEMYLPKPFMREYYHRKNNQKPWTERKGKEGEGMKRGGTNKKDMSGMEELISIRQFPLNRAPK